MKYCIDCNKPHNNISGVCTACILLRKQERQQNKTWQYLKIKYGMPYNFVNFQNQYLGNWNTIDEVEEMPKAILSYEALQLDSEGIPTEGAYKLKLEGNFKNHIEPIVKFIKAAIPSSDRTYDPASYEWAFHEKYYPLMENAFKGSHFQVSFTVRKEDFVELKRKQAEFAKQAGQSFATRQVPVEEDITKFFCLLEFSQYLWHSITGILPSNIEILKSWTRQEAEKAYKKAIRFYHPDLHPERAAQASELNEVWSRLKEGYYIK